MTRAMHQKIICQKPVLTPTTAGEQSEVMTEIATVWAEVAANSSGQATLARQNHLSKSFKIIVRHQDKLLATRNILWQGEAYRVVGLINPDNRKRFIEFDVVEDQP